MSKAKIEAELEVLRKLGKKSKGDFLEEARRMLGTTVFGSLSKKDIQSVDDLFRAVCRIVRTPEVSHRQKQEDIRVGQDAAAQCHS